LLIRPFRIFSLFRPSDTVISSTPSETLLRPLHLLSTDDSPDAGAAVQALIDFNTYLAQLVKCTQSETDHLGEVSRKDGNGGIAALNGYCLAFRTASRAAWANRPDTAEMSFKSPDLERSLSVSLQGVFHLCRSLDDTRSGIGHRLGDPLLALEAARQAIFTAVYPDQAYTADHFSLLFERAREFVQTLQVAYRPLAHSKGSIRAPATVAAEVRDEDAMLVIRLLDIFACGVEGLDRLGLTERQDSTAERRDDAAEKPLRIGMDVRMLGCDLAMSMANNRIKDIRHRAQAAHARDSKADKQTQEGEASSNGEEGKSNGSGEEDGGIQDTVRWEDEAEQQLLSALLRARDILEEKQGGVLTKRKDFCSSHQGRSVSPVSIQGSEASTSDNDDTSDTESDTSGDSTSSDEGDTVDSYPCPLRALFRLHDRYEEQRLAVWLTLPTSTRQGMGTYMRGPEGKMGEAWDALGLLLLLDHPR